MSTFPTSIPSYLGFTAGHTLLVDIHAAQHNQEQADIIALANKVGTGASTPATGLVLTASGTGTSSWSQVNLTTMVSGVLPVANGGTGTTSTTGTGAVVFASSPTITNPTESGGTYNTATLNSPTIITPTIASFINAVHNHQNNAGGGQLDFGALLSTIFSGQVQTQTNVGTAGGTMWWVNLGGIKILWAASALNSVGTGGASIVFTLPTFFTTVQSWFNSVMDLNTDANQYTTVLAHSTSSFTLWIHSGTNGSQQQTGLLIIGT